MMGRLRITREQIVAAALVATALGVGSLILQRWVAETRGVAIAMVIAWYALVGVAALVWFRSDPQRRQAALATLGAVTLATIAVGYWTGFRDREVDENVVVATSEVSAAERGEALAGAAPDASETVEMETPAAEPEPKPAGPVNLAAGSFTGVDGHDGSGTASVVRQPDGTRLLTFTQFDVDPGPEVIVYLTRDDTGPGEDPVDLGSLKGNVGDQQYEIPADANLSEFDTVVLWCVPFTTRIAVAPLG